VKQAPQTVAQAIRSSNETALASVDARLIEVQAQISGSDELLRSYRKERSELQILRTQLRRLLGKDAPAAPVAPKPDKPAPKTKTTRVKE